MNIFAILFTIALTATISECQSVVERSEPVSPIRNDEPIIGVLSLEPSPAMRNNFPGNYQSYIAASYIKFVEGAGARAVPLWIGRNKDYYEDIMKNLNGVLLPGGATYFNETGGYADAGRMIYQIAKDMNNKGIYMPVWGTCLGYELMLYIDKNDTEHRVDCNSLGQLLPLDFKADARSSRMFANAPDDVFNMLSTENITYNSHQFCTTEETFHKLGLDNDWRVMSTNVDFNGLKFISSLEHKTYPFYGIQFHPEKNIYEWAANKSFPHSSDAIHVAQYFADFLINECRKNNNSFRTEAERLDSLIQNYSPTFSGRGKSSFYQVYFFQTKNSGASKSISQILFTAILVMIFTKSVFIL